MQEQNGSLDVQRLLLGSCLGLESKKQKRMAQHCRRSCMPAQQRESSELGSRAGHFLQTFGGDSWLTRWRVGNHSQKNSIQVFYVNSEATAR